MAPPSDDLRVRTRVTSCRGSTLAWSISRRRRRGPQVGLEAVHRDGLHGAAQAQSEELGTPLDYFVGALVLWGERRCRGPTPHVHQLRGGEGLGRLNQWHGRKGMCGKGLHVAKLAQELLDVGLLGGEELTRQDQGLAVQEFCRGEARILLGCCT